MTEICEVRKSASNPRWYCKNLNPWGFNVNDCVLRAYSIGLLMKYEFLFACAKDAKNASVWNLTKTCNFINGMNDDELASALPPGFVGKPKPAGAITLNAFVDEMEARGESGIYIVGAGNTHKQHIVCAYVKTRNSYFIDSFDSGELKAFEYRKVLKQVRKGDPRRLDLRTILRPDNWKIEFRKAFFEAAQAWENETDPAKKRQIAQDIEFMASGELYDLDEPENVDMRGILGKNASVKSGEIAGTE